MYALLHCYVNRCSDQALFRLPADKQRILVYGSLFLDAFYPSVLSNTMNSKFKKYRAASDTAVHTSMIIFRHH